MTAKEENKEIVSRLDKITPAPWCLMKSMLPNTYCVFSETKRRYSNEYDICTGMPDGESDMEFIAHAPEDMRKLLDALGEAKSERSRLIECLEALGRKTQGDTICDICIHRNLSGKDEPCIDCLHPNKHFHLDEARIFTGGDGE